jgi:hypothetical protein
MEPVGWVTQIEPICHGAPHNRLCPDARSCRIEGLAPGRIYTQECIIFHDSASVLTSQRQLLRNLFT